MQRPCKHKPQEPQSEDSDDQYDQSDEADLGSSSDGSNGEEEQSSEESDDEEDDQSSEGTDSEEDEQTTDEEEFDPNREQDSESEDEDGDGESSEESSSEPEQRGPREHQPQRSGQRSRQNPDESRRKRDLGNQTQQHKRSSSEHQKSKRKTPWPANPAKKLGKKHDIPKQKGTPPQSTKEAKKPPTPKTSRDARVEKVKAKQARKPEHKEERTTTRPKSEEFEKAESPYSDTKKASQREKKDQAKTARGHDYRGSDTYNKRRSQEHRRNKLEKQERFHTCPDDQERQGTQQGRGERRPARREEPRFPRVRDALQQDHQKGVRRENKTKDIWLNSADQVCRDRYAGRAFPPDGQPKHAHKKRYSDKCGKELHAYDLVEILAREEDFDISILRVIRERNVSPVDVQTVLNNHANIFHIKSDRFRLKPRLKLCAGHSSTNGCENRIYCVALHICQNFLKGICKYEACNSGHTFATGHNKKVLGNFFLDQLGDDTLLRVFSKSPPKTTSNSQKGRDQRTRYSSPNRAFFETSESDAYSLSGDDTASDADHLYGGSKRKKPSPSKKKKQIQTVWSTDSNGDVEIPEICYNSVESSCLSQDEGCEKLHSFQHFHWQISKDNSKWFNLPPKLVLCLEKSYCDVSKDGVTLPRLKGDDLQAVHIDAVKILSRDKWTSDFQSMTLKNSNHKVQLHLRRLCSEKTDSASVKANTFCWYFRDDNEKWISYDNSEEQRQCNEATSEDIEKHYLAKPSTPFCLRSQKFNYVLDFQRMCQVNIITNKRREIRRRPLEHLQETPDRSFLPEDWQDMQPKERMRLVDLDPKSDEFKKVVNLLKDDTYKAKVKQIQRNQNPYLWKTFQLRKEDMITQYGDEASVKMTDLFHGTNPDIVRNICKENFDFRLHGKSIGHIWGKGSYFGNDIALCYRYCRPDSNGLKYLFVAKVLVGTITVGAKELERPPLNPATNELFDTTVDNETQPNIFVKYDKQEYYPHYVMIME